MPPKPNCFVKFLLAAPASSGRLASFGTSQTKFVHDSLSCPHGLKDARATGSLAARPLTCRVPEHLGKIRSMWQLDALGWSELNRGSDLCLQRLAQRAVRNCKCFAQVRDCTDHGCKRFVYVWRVQLPKYMGFCLQFLLLTCDPFRADTFQAHGHLCMISGSVDVGVS